MQQPSAPYRSDQSSYPMAIGYPSQYPNDGTYVILPEQNNPAPLSDYQTAMNLHHELNDQSINSEQNSSKSTQYDNAETNHHNAESSQNTPSQVIIVRDSSRDNSDLAYCVGGGILGLMCCTIM